MFDCSKDTFTKKNWPGFQNGRCQDPNFTFINGKYYMSTQNSKDLMIYNPYEAKWEKNPHFFSKN